VPNLRTQLLQLLTVFDLVRLANRPGNNAYAAYQVLEVWVQLKNCFKFGWRLIKEG
jgi:hypothetical protein